MTIRRAFLSLLSAITFCLLPLVLTAQTTKAFVEEFTNKGVTEQQIMYASIH